MIALHVDESKRDARLGLQYTAVIAGQHKADFSSHEPLSDQALARIQSVVDDQYGLFVAAVARYRGLSEDAVRGTEAQIFTAPEALDIGLIDGIATLADVLCMLSSTNAQKSLPASWSWLQSESAALGLQPTLEQPALEYPMAPANAIALERERIAQVLALPEAASRRAMAVTLACAGHSVGDVQVALRSLPDDPPPGRSWQMEEMRHMDEAAERGEPSGA